jgi:hypothetical protein
MNTVAEQQEGAPSASNDADNIGFEGLKAMLNQNKPEEVNGEANEQADPDATENSEVVETQEVEQPEGIEDQSAEAETTDEVEENSIETDESDGLDDKTQQSINKRIGKLTSQKKKAEEAKQEYQSQLENAQEENRKLQEQLDKQGTERLQANDPLASVMTKKELGEQRKQYKDWQRWARRNPQGGEFEFPDGKSEHYNAEQSENILNYAEDMLEEHIPKREDWLQNHSKLDGLASQHFPAWKQTSTDVYAQYQEILREMPELKRFPNYKQLVGVFHRGLVAYNADIAGQNNVPAKPQAKKVKTLTPTNVVSPASAPPPASATKTAASISDAEKFVEQSNGSPDAVMQLLNARRAAKVA